MAYRLNPLPKQLGQKYGKRFPAIRKAILALEADPALRICWQPSSWPLSAWM